MSDNTLQQPNSIQENNYDNNEKEEVCIFKSFYLFIYILEYLFTCFILFSN